MNKIYSEEERAQRCVELFEDMPDAMLKEMPHGVMALGATLGAVMERMDALAGVLSKLVTAVDSENEQNVRSAMMVAKLMLSAVDDRASNKACQGCKATSCDTCESSTKH